MSLTAPYETQLYSSARFCGSYLSKQSFEFSDAQRVLLTNANDYSITNIANYHNRNPERF